MHSLLIEDFFRKGSISFLESETGHVEDDKGFPPKFIKALSDQGAICGKPATLSVEVEGQPEPDVNWTVDDEEIFEDEGIAFTQEGRVHSLVFKETVEEDEGVYKCLAKNAHGEIECSAKFTIAQETTKPEFVQKMKHVEVVDTSEARFEVEVTGSPDPEIKWLKKKEVLVNSEKFSIIREGSVASLVINDCTSDDVGVYQAVAENSAGKVSCNAQLTVTKKAEPPNIITPKDFPSKFVLKSGERFIVEFTISGEVEEKYWLRNGKKLDQNERLKISYENEKVTLLIEIVEEIDDGVYELIASNSNGKAVNAITLAVEGLFNVSQNF